MGNKVQITMTEKQLVVEKGYFTECCRCGSVQLCTDGEQQLCDCIKYEYNYIFYVIVINLVCDYVNLIFNYNNEISCRSTIQYVESECHMTSKPKWISKGKILGVGLCYNGVEYNVKIRMGMSCFYFLRKMRKVSLLSNAFEFKALLSPTRKIMILRYINYAY